MQFDFYTIRQGVTKNVISIQFDFYIIRHGVTKIVAKSSHTTNQA